MPESPYAPTTAAPAPLTRIVAIGRSAGPPARPWPVYLVEQIADAAASGELAQEAVSRVATAHHPMEEMQGSLPIEMHCFSGALIAVAPDEQDRLTVECRSIFGLQAIGIPSPRDARALAAVLSAFADAMDGRAAWEESTLKTAGHLRQKRTRRRAN